MKTLTLLSILIFAMTGCASKPDFREAKNGAAGYAEQKITDDRYRVQFKSYSHDVADASDYALLRAAQITLAQGYDWFVVTSKETFVESEKVQPQSAIGMTQARRIERHCGLLSCETRSRPSTEVAMSINTGMSQQRKEVVSIIEVRMGKGLKLNDDSYGAQDVLDNLSDKIKGE